VVKISRKVGTIGKKPSKSVKELQQDVLNGQHLYSTEEVERLTEDVPENLRTVLQGISSLHIQTFWALANDCGMSVDDTSKKIFSQTQMLALSLAIRAFVVGRTMDK
jgi:hypothetical protein